jgi:multiple sugar transport system permease protein
MATLVGQVARDIDVPPMRRRPRAGKVVRRTLLWILNLFFLLFFLFPFFWQTTTSLKPDSEIQHNPIMWFPSRLDFSHYYNVFTPLYHFGQAIENSVIVASVSTFFAMVLGTLAAYSLAKLPLPAKRTIMVLVIVMITFPAIALVSSLFIFERDLHLTDTYWGYFVPYVTFSLPFAIWVLTNFFREIPADISEQAEVDGCTALQSLVRVILPLSAPALVTSGLLIFIGGWNEFLFAFTFMSQPSMYTVPVAINYFGGIHNVPWGELTAASEVTSLPIVALVLIFQRLIVQGLTSGSLKG